MGFGRWGIFSRESIEKRAVATAFSLLIYQRGAREHSEPIPERVLGIETADMLHDPQRRFVLNWFILFHWQSSSWIKLRCQLAQHIVNGGQLLALAAGDEQFCVLVKT